MTDRPTDPAPPRPGVRVYCDSHDVTRPRETVAKLRACGAVEAIAMVEGITGDRGSTRASLDTVRAFVDACHEHDIGVTACAFPDVRDMRIDGCARSRQNLAACAEMGCELELDAEPRGGVHWTGIYLAPWLALSPTLSVTTTRIEAPHLGRVDRLVRGQLEQMESTDTLDAALRLISQCTHIDRIQPVIGTFDQRGLVRTVAMIERDLERCIVQARASGGLAVWSAHTMSDVEAKTILSWALRTF